jgi:hypothetical protein
MNFIDAMVRYYGEIERNLYAVEQLCPHKDAKGTPSCQDHTCPFNDPWSMLCRKERIRIVMGERTEEPS